MPSWSDGPETPEDIAADRAQYEATKDLTMAEIVAACRMARSEIAREREAQ